MADSEHTPAPASDSARILIADDEAGLLRALAKRFRRLGHVVTEAADGPSALQAIEREAFDVILSDISMPGLNGMDLLRTVRLSDLDVPIILITGAPETKTAVEAIELGAYRYLIKPLDLPLLDATIGRAIQLHRFAREKRDALAQLGLGVAAAADRAGLEASFERALETLWMAFQPIVRGSDATLFGYEALLRSREPSLPHPGAILDAAERLGGLTTLGRAVRDRSAADFTGAVENGVLFLNLHPRDLDDEELLGPASPLAQMAPRVILEITERAALDGVKDVQKTVARLRALGFRIAIDDLGAGYAGLTSVAVLEPEVIKIDMSLVRGIEANATKRRLVGAITNLGRELGALIVAEGVETKDERDVVVDLGCDLVQGYLLARPGPPFPAFTW